MTVFIVLGMVFTSISVQAAEPPAPAKYVELHAHLFMKEGLKLLFTGSFFDPLCAHDHEDRFRSQANPQSLRESQNAITVVSLYAHPILTGWNLMDSLRAQVDQARRFVRENPDFVIARTPAEARAALRRHQRVLVFSLEGAYGTLDHPENLDEMLDDWGVNIVTLLHLTDDDLGGGAFLHGWQVLANPAAFLSQFWRKTYNAEGVWVNPEGLTSKGQELMKTLIERKVWIDLSHATDAAYSKMAVLLLQAKQPFLYTHTSLRRHLKAERGVSDSQLRQVAATRGMLGLMPSEDMLKGTVIEPRFCPASAGACEGGISALAQQFSEASDEVGPRHVTIGTDWNGGIRHLPGFFQIGQTPELWRDLEKLGAPVASVQDGATVGEFLNAWEQVKISSLAKNSD